MKDTGTLPNFASSFLYWICLEFYNNTTVYSINLTCLVQQADNKNYDNGGISGFHIFEEANQDYPLKSKHIIRSQTLIIVCLSDITLHQV